MEICLPGFEVSVKMPERFEPDLVNHPPHYCVGGLECFDVMKRIFGIAAVKIFCRLNAFKYMFRSENKNGEQDIAKADWYLKKYLELCKEQPKVGGIDPEKRAELKAAVNALIEAAQRCRDAHDDAIDDSDPGDYYQDLDDLANAEATLYHLFGTKTDWELAEEEGKKREGEREK